jgi:glycerol kinase
MLEAICFQTREVLDAMRADADMSTMNALRVDGGAAKNNLLMQLQVGFRGCAQHGIVHGMLEEEEEATNLVQAAEREAPCPAAGS